jgi:hypothetical protein
MRRFLDLVACCTLVGLLILAPMPGGAQESTPATADEVAALVLPPESPAFGLRYEGWSARFAEWALSLPMAVHPNMDATGERCGYGQTGPVFFLVQSSAGSAERTCTVPAGKAILIPLLDASCTTVEPPPFHGRDETELRACAEALFATPAELTAVIDGSAIPNLERYRVQSELFSVALPADNWLEVEPAVAAGVADGYWLLLAPLPPGEHELRFGGALPDIGVSAEVTYHLIVAEPAVVDQPSDSPEASPTA